MIETLTVITALVGGPALFRAVVGPGRGAPMPGDDERRLRLAVRGGSLVAIALLVAAPLGLFGAWAAALGLCALLSLLRPDWMIPGRGAPNAMRGAAGYALLALIMALAWFGFTPQHGMGPHMGGGHGPGAGGIGEFDLLALGTLLVGRAWLWFGREGAPFSKKARRLHRERARAGLHDRSHEDMGRRAGQAWWDRVWSQRRAREDADFAEAEWSPVDPEPTPEPEPQPEPKREPAYDPAAADAALRVPGYDPALLGEELATFRDHLRLIDRVAVTWPSHPVSEALIHVSVILNETRRFLQAHPDKYRDLRPILVGHAATAADIARLVDRIKSTGETIDDADGVAHRLFALASLMRETRRKSTQAERDRLKASMAVIDDELSALSAVQDLRARMAAERPQKG
ncbi:hypothetical protein F1188_11935 [Roseospira marina]|uniref:Uncharacterized protein n=1 Tax=Roseospira marina TaxID=140057 RepID=A0A5M6IAX6_9PROT|nr:hypothetical protein [Roseospira marina]KAA5605272.1 hypothetical protein F1188_11935 [Roseospira marina]MBB4314732.1 hypothetical protein [Roseospira marina]MBB5087721.1 hypothetical protein [Roseospira marina]